MFANSNSYNSTGAATDPLAREARTIPRLLRVAALTAAAGMLVAGAGVASASAAYHPAPRPVAACFDIYYHAVPCS